MTSLSRWTRATTAGLASDSGRGAVIPPLYLSTNYTFHAPGESREHDYSRSGNPTRDVLADALTELEDGAGAVIVGSGMAAASVTLEALVLDGGRVVAAHDAYGGTWRLLDVLARRGRFELDLVDLSDPAAAAAALAAPATLVWIETPSNPLLRITDIEEVARLGHAAGAQVVVDNTFCTPLTQQPLALGADVVIHSTTKFIAGHSDVVGGAIVAKDADVVAELAWWANTLGATAGAFDSYLTMRGLRSLEARLRIHDENAQAVVDAFDGHPAVRALHYPGLPDHPQYELARRQMRSQGSIVTVDFAGGRPAVDRFLDGLPIFHLAESLGGTESLVCHPATMTHAAMSAPAQRAAGITDGMLRLSVGLESIDDLVAVIVEGLERVDPAGGLDA